MFARLSIDIIEIMRFCSCFEIDFLRMEINVKVSFTCCVRACVCARVCVLGKGCDGGRQSAKAEYKFKNFKMTRIVLVGIISFLEDEKYV